MNGLLGKIFELLNHKYQKWAYIFGKDRINLHGKVLFF